MPSKVVQRLVLEGRLEKVPPDSSLAHRMLRTATRNLRAIGAIKTTAPELAYTGAYDAARISITAHMAAHGLRLTSRPGSHMAVVEYARSELTNLVEADVLDNLDAMRRLRNDTEYGARQISSSEVSEVAELATALTKALVEELI